MATLTIRNLPDEIVDRIKEIARRKGSSMEQEVRELLKIRYADRDRILARARNRWPELPASSPEELEGWKNAGRP